MSKPQIHSLHPDLQELIGSGGGLAEIPQATETILGGIKAKEKTTETNEVAIDPATGKLYTNGTSEGTGYIAELTVDSLLTDTKVQNYLIADLSPIEYQSIKGKTYQFWHGTTDGSSNKQAETRFGEKLYWLDDTYNGATLEVTDYPVMIYEYTESLQFQITYSVGQGIELRFGEGDGVLENSSKFYIRKLVTSAELTYYRSNTAEPRKLILSDDTIKIEGNTGDTGLRNIGVGTVLPTTGENNELFILKGGA